jgi:hypothetical protein
VLQLYLEGLGFRSIGRFLECNHVAVCNWIKAHGGSIEAIRSTAGVEVVEPDEMHTFAGSKKTMAGYGLLLIDMGNASSTAKTETGRKLWDAIKNDSITGVMSGYWNSCEKFVPPGLQSKAETYTVEGYNSLFRHNGPGCAESPSATAKARIC